MKTTLSKSQAYSLLEGLKKSIFEFRCPCTRNRANGQCVQDLDHPILLGNVIGEFCTAGSGEERDKRWVRIIKRWMDCDIELSLQDFLEGAEFEVLPCKEVHSNDRDCTNTEPVLKDEKVEALFQFLISLQLVK